MQQQEKEEEQKEEQEEEKERIRLANLSTHRPVTVDICHNSDCSRR